MRHTKTAVERLRNRIESVTKDDGQSSPLSIATLLRVLSILYGAVMVIRAHLYKKGFLPSRALPCRVVSIGNINAGGTGKTPMTIFVAQTIKHLGYRVVVISRGYKGRMEHSGGVVSDGRAVFQGPADTGDEPYLMATALTDIPVVVGSDRYQAGMLAIRRFAPDVIVLDDAFQHLQLERDVDLVLLDHQAPLGNGYLLPRGRLREPVSALHRAHAIVFTRCNIGARPHPLPPQLSHRPAFYSTHIPVIHFVHTTDEIAFEEGTDYSILKGRKAVAFSGLADNNQFYDSLEQGGCRLVHQFAFGDHHQYCTGDLERIVKKAVAKGANLLITTAKDWVKIQSIYRYSMTVIVVDVRIGWREDPACFHTFLSTALSTPTNRS